MAMVKAIVDCFIDNGYRRAGDTFRYEGPEIPDVIEFIDGAPSAPAVGGEPERKLRPGRKPKSETAPA